MSNQDELLKELKIWGCDVDTALERMLNDHEFLLRCIAQVVNDSSFGELENALQGQNVLAAFEAAHTLKGLLGNTGLLPLYNIAADIVEPLRQGKIADLFFLYEKLVEKNNELKGILDKFCSTTLLKVT